MTHGSLFAGIGGFDLGFERAGIKTVWQVEIDPFCRKVLERHWPNVQRFEDVRGCGRHNLARVDIITGGFPCQDISHAGKKAGIADGTRSGLWSEMHRIVGELRPRLVLVENVSAILDGPIGRVLADLAALGFDAEWKLLRAENFGAPHERKRVFLIAYANQGDGQEGLGAFEDRPQTIFGGSMGERFPIWLQAADRFIGVADGLSARVYESRAGAVGNAVLPQIAQWLGERIIHAHSELSGLGTQKDLSQSQDV